MNYIAKKFFVLILILMVPAVWGQDRKQLEKDRKSKLAEIEETTKILEQTRSKKNISLKQLKTINNLIKVREEIIESLAMEVNSVENQVSKKTQQLIATKVHLQTQKEKYAKSIYNAYRLKGSAGNKWHFIFSAKSFNQIMQRLKYLEKIAEFQNKIVGNIEEDRVNLEEGIQVLQGLKVEKEEILGDKEVEKEKLVGDKSQQQNVVNALSGQEKDLRKKLVEQRAAKAKLDNEIERLIRIELEKARKKKAYSDAIEDGDNYYSSGKYDAALSAYKKALAEGVNNTEAKSRIEKTKTALEKDSKVAGEATPPEINKPSVNTNAKVDQQLSSTFASNKGKLPWPVGNGFVSEQYGKHAHPTLRGVTIENNGTNFLSSNGSVARSVFKGEVVAVMEIPGMQNMVMVSHGDYFTVYAKLASVFVKVGDKVDTKQSIGKIYTNDGNETELHFELWFNQAKQNPEYWISK